MQLDSLITAINDNCPSVRQVLIGDGLVRETIDTSKLIYDLAKNTVSNRAYPLKMPENPTLPALVYQLVSSGKVPIDQIDIFQTDTQVIYFHSNDYSELVSLRQSIRNAFIAYDQPNAAGVIEINDEAIAWLENQKRYECSMELYITHLIHSNQNIPAVFVYENKTRGNGDVNCGKQMIAHEIVVIGVAKKSLITQVRNEVLETLIGFQITSQHFEMEHLQGDRIDSAGQMVVWRDTFETKIKH